MTQQPYAVQLSRQVASRARALRIERGFTYARLAAATGLSSSAIYGYETGLRNLTFPVLERVLTALETEPAALFPPAGTTPMTCPRCGGCPPAGFICGSCYQTGVLEAA